MTALRTALRRLLPDGRLQLRVPFAAALTAALVAGSIPASAPAQSSYPPATPYPGQTYPPASAYPQSASSQPVSASPAPAGTPDPTASPRYYGYGPGYTPPPSGEPGAPRPGDATYHQDDLIGAAEGVFGKGAHGLADMIKDILKKQGEPNAYIAGREGGGALIVGLRYGSGTLFHKVEGQKPVYWTGPSLGLDAGGSAGKTFVLVYNLHNSEDLYRRFGAGEGQAYLIGGFNVSYLRRGDVVLIPVRMGVGLRLGINGGYMKFTKKQNWMPF